MLQARIQQAAARIANGSTAVVDPVLLAMVPACAVSLLQGTLEGSQLELVSALAAAQDVARQARLANLQDRQPIASAAATMALAAKPEPRKIKAIARVKSPCKGTPCLCKASKRKAIPCAPMGAADCFERSLSCDALPYWAIGSMADRHSAPAVPRPDTGNGAMVYTVKRTVPSALGRGAIRAIGPKGIGSAMPADDDPRAIAIHGSRSWDFGLPRAHSRAIWLEAIEGLRDAGMARITVKRATAAGDSGCPFRGIRFQAYKTPAGRLAHLAGESADF